MSVQSSKRVVALTLAVAIVAALPFLPALSNGFVSWDDDKNFLANEAYRGLGWTQLKWMWTTFHLGHYVPLSWMTLGLDYTLWGMDARGYHLTGIVIHAAHAALLFLVARRVLALAFEREPNDATILVGAAVASLWFAVHPLRVESVAWVTERRDVLSGAFYAATVLAYLSFATTNNRSRYALAIGLYAAALLSKASAMTMPATLLLLNVYPLRRIQPGAWNHPALRNVARELIPFATLSVATMVLSIVALSPGEQLPLAGKLAISAHSLWFYSFKSLLPVGLAAYYPLPRVIDFGAARFVAGYLTLAAFAALTIMNWKRRPGLSVGLVAWIAILLPTIGVVQNGPQLAADRYSYQAAPALALLLGAVATLGWKRHRTLTVALGVAVIATLGTLTWKQTGFWRDSRTLWTRVLAVSSDAAIAHNALGNLDMNDGRVSSALEHFRNAVRLDPQFAAAHDNLGVALARLGRPGEAIGHFEQAIAAKDESDEAYNNWGAVLMSQGDLTGAVEKFEKAIALDSTSANAEANLAAALARGGAFEEALAHFRRATTLQPALAPAHANWGAVLARLGRWDEARERLHIALSLDPSDIETRAALDSVEAELRNKAPAGTTVRP